MDQKRISIFSDSFRIGLLPGIAKSAELGAGAVQLYTEGTALNPQSYDHLRRKELLSYVHGLGLKVSSICADLDHVGLSDAEENIRKLPRFMKQIDMAADFECATISSQIGIIPQEEQDPVYRVLLDAVGQIGVYAQHRGVRFAIETGPEMPQVLHRFIAQLLQSVGVNLDPANLVMITGADPIAAAQLFAGRIYHVHVKDGKMFKPVGAQTIYRYMTHPDNSLRLDECYLELPLGKGDVNIKAWVAKLRETGYEGYYTIERKSGENPERDVRMAVNFLRGV